MVLLRSTAWPYIVAVGVVLIATAVRALLDPLLGDQLPFYLFYFAVIAAALRGGFGPGIVALLLGFAVATYFFAQPRFSFTIDDTENIVGAFRFVTIGAVLVIGASWGRNLKSKWNRELQVRQRVEAQARSVQEETLSTLASIGDGLIAVDTQGRITFMNAVAERLSGWERAAAQGRKITEVFRVQTPAGSRGGDPAEV